MMIRKYASNNVPSGKCIDWITKSSQRFPFHKVVNIERKSEELLVFVVDTNYFVQCQFFFLTIVK